MKQCLFYWHFTCVYVIRIKCYFEFIHIMWIKLLYDQHFYRISFFCIYTMSLTDIGLEPFRCNTKRTNVDFVNVIRRGGARILYNTNDIGYECIVVYIFVELDNAISFFLLSKIQTKWACTIYIYPYHWRC